MCWETSRWRFWLRTRRWRSPENELHQSGHNPDELERLTVPERVDVLEHVEWARDWASAMAEKFGMPETAEEREELERHALEYLATEAWV